MSFTTTVSLSEDHIWRKLYPHMEMCVRKQKPFWPQLSFNVNGLNETDHYELVISMERYDNIRYAFSKGKWAKSTVRKMIPPEPIKYVTHVFGVQQGSKWMKDTVTFEVKLTNKLLESEKPEKNLVVLTTMHKYVPVVTINNLTTSESLRFPMEVAQFIPVTEYLSDEISAWKTETNKYSTDKNREKGKRKASAGSTRQPAAKRKPRASRSSRSRPSKHVQKQPAMAPDQHCAPHSDSSPEPAAPPTNWHVLNHPANVPDQYCVPHSDSSPELAQPIANCHVQHHPATVPDQHCAPQYDSTGEPAPVQYPCASVPPPSNFDAHNQPATLPESFCVPQYNSTGEPTVMHSPLSSEGSPSNSPVHHFAPQHSHYDTSQNPAVMSCPPSNFDVHNHPAILSNQHCTPPSNSHIHQFPANLPHQYCASQSDGVPSTFESPPSNSHIHHLPANVPIQHCVPQYSHHYQMCPDPSYNPHYDPRYHQHYHQNSPVHSTYYTTSPEFVNPHQQLPMQQFYHQ